MGVGTKKKPRSKLGRGSKSRASSITKKLASPAKRKKTRRRTAKPTEEQLAIARVLAGRTFP
jgi:hypothetical protein